MTGCARQTGVLRSLAIALIAAGTTAGSTAQEVITAETLTDEHVGKAVSAIVDELYRRKVPARHWEPSRIPTGESTRQQGGYTALTVLALLSAGESYQDPRLRDAVEYLEQFGMQGTYAVAVRALIWAKLPARFQPSLEQDVVWLLEGFSPRVGGWDYVQNPTTTRRDNSIRQFGALAMWEAARRGARIPERYWRALEEAYLDGQLPDGGWNYKGDDRPATGSMTTAGLATLYITQDLLHAGEYISLTGTRDPRVARSIDKGLGWLNANFSAVENPGAFADFYYYLWGVERVGLASGRKHFGGKDWFREGAAELIRRLCAWDPDERTMRVHERIGGEGRASQVGLRELGFGLLFLSRGRVPVAVNKLEVPGLAWNNRPRDVANLVDWISEKSEGSLNWQIVSIDEPVTEWLDAPVVYLASDEPVPWFERHGIDPLEHIRAARQHREELAEGASTASAPARPEITEVEKLKQYLDLGGMLLAVGEGRSRSFANSIEVLGSFMYPHHRWEKLHAEHWAFSLYEPVGGRRPSLKALSNGVRELIILADRTDLSETLQSREARDAGHFQAAANVYFHASEMNRPRPRLARHARAATVAAPGDDVPTIAQIAYDGNWNPEPMALAMLAADGGPAVAVQTIGFADLAGSGADLALVRGIDEHAFSPAESEAIRSYVRDGGHVLFETPGGRGRFTESAEQAMARLFGAEPALLVGHAMLTAEPDPLTRVDYRPYCLEVFGGRESTPRLRVISVDGRPALLFSREDVSHALLDQPCWGVSGYAPGSARRLLARIISHTASTRRPQSD